MISLAHDGIRKSGSTLETKKNLKHGCKKCQMENAALQRSAIRSSQDIDPPIVHEVLIPPGRPATRAFKEPRFRHDFSHTRVHNDARAAESKQAAQLTQRLMRSGSLQLKLKINDTGDTFENEAARVAQHVMLMPTPSSEEADRVSFQRENGGEIKLSQMKIPAIKIAPQLQSYPDQRLNLEQGPDLDGRQIAGNGGSPLPASIRAFMEPRFRADFGGVRLHTGSEAAELNRSLKAHAFTYGRDIYLGEGWNDIESNAGRHLLAHELTHVIQQIGNGILQANHMPEENAHMSLNSKREIEQKTANGTQHISRAQESIQRKPDTPPEKAGQSSGSCNVSLCFLPLEVLLDAGVPPGLAYIAAVHAFIRWDGKSAGFTRLSGERISDARVISPEPRAGQSHERCINARLRTIPTPTPGQLIPFGPMDAIRDVISYGVDLYRSLRQCRNPSCEDSKRRIQNMLIDDRRGLYDLFDENCETWARNILSNACMESPELHLGGIGNIALRILRETPGGDLYHLARILLGKTRPMPTPGTMSGPGSASTPIDYGSGGAGGAGGSSDYGSGGARGSGGVSPSS